MLEALSDVLCHYGRARSYEHRWVIVMLPVGCSVLFAQVRLSVAMAMCACQWQWQCKLRQNRLAPFATLRNVKCAIPLMYTLRVTTCRAMPVSPEDVANT